MNTDQFPVRVVVVGLVIVLLLGTVGVIGLAYVQTPIPDALDRLIVFVAGAVAGILAKTSGNTESVTVANSSDNPVPTENV